MSGSPSSRASCRLLREETIEDPDDDLLNLLKGGVVFNAVTGRKHLLLEERRRLAEAEPLPEELAAAFAEVPGDVVGTELIRLGLHLVLADVVAAGLVPEKSLPETVVAATPGRHAPTRRARQKAQHRPVGRLGENDAPEDRCPVRRHRTGLRVEAAGLRRLASSAATRSAGRSNH